MKTLDWNVYLEIKARSEKGEWTSVAHLAEKFNVGKRTIRKAVLNIREEERIQKIILTDYGKGYKLMSEADEYDLLFKDKIKILKELKRYHKQARRYNLHHQIKLTFDTKERDFIESLIQA